MEIKKAHNGAMSFCLARKLHLIKNMQESLKKCMSNDNLCLNVVFLCVVFLLNSTLAYAGVDATGNKLYYKLVGIGKWVIIFKGAIDIIQSVISGDFQAAKKMFMGYLFAYAILFALPFCMNEVENIFKEM
ncbi:hypothetical protein J2Z76_000421 [Sedimentibacter acidaminivorans]|uniref:Uncharacterized protein n=1 Tax=Sedimentibacter acidaminivorans TaxID=913099 RepID=A0ABS4GA55_9FIRM|nr:hypothetical protein [Sedimentibacter acidaminivorans]MBP1924568.1 hypothetical protein [Sedimentibacter acidaminivorans]